MRLWTLFTGHFLAGPSNRIDLNQFNYSFENQSAKNWLRSFIYEMTKSFSVSLHSLKLYWPKKSPHIGYYFRHSFQLLINGLKLSSAVPHPVTTFSKLLLKFNGPDTPYYPILYPPLREDDFHRSFTRGNQIIALQPSNPSHSVVTSPSGVRNMKQTL